MIEVVRSKDGTIKTFCEKISGDYNRALGEYIELIDSTFQDYAQRLVISCNGISGETISVKQGTPELSVDVYCHESPTDIDINGTIEHLYPINGVSEIKLGTEVPGVFVIQPADRAKYCAGGQGLLVIEVNP